MSKTVVHALYAGSVVAIAAIAAASYVYVQTSTPHRVSNAPAYTMPVVATAPVARPAPIQAAPVASSQLASLEQAYATAAQALPASGLQDPQAAASILNILSGLSYIEGKTKLSAGQQYAYIFFDPRCQYCHAAHDELDSKMPIRWVPIPLLGNDPLPLVTALLQKPSSENLDKAFAGLLPEPTAAVPSGLTKLTPNIDAFRTFMTTLDGQGVPILIIPRPNGTIYGQVGYSAGDGKSVLAEYGA